MNFISLTEQLDTGSPSGRLLFHVVAALAEFERSIIRERVNAGLAAAKARGRVGGRPRSVTDDDIEAAKALLEAGQFTVKQVAERIGCSVATLYRRLPAARNSVMNGETA